MLDSLVLKNAVECTSQRLKWTADVHAILGRPYVSEVCFPKVSVHSRIPQIHAVEQILRCAHVVQVYRVTFRGHDTFRIQL